MLTTICCVFPSYVDVICFCIYDRVVNKHGRLDLTTDARHKGGGQCRVGGTTRHELSIILSLTYRTQCSKSKHKVIIVEDCACKVKERSCMTASNC